MNIKSKYIIIMITCFALISCMTIISAADVPNANHTDAHNQVTQVHSTNNEHLITQNTEINSKNNNIQKNPTDNKNKFQNQQSKLNLTEKKSLSENQKQPDIPTKTNKTQSRALPQQDQNNSPINITSKLNDNTSPEIQQPQNQYQPKDNNEKNLNNNTIPQQNINYSKPATISNTTPQFECNTNNFQEKNTNINEPKQNDIIKPENNNNMTFKLDKNQKPQKPQKNSNKNIPLAIRNTNPKFNNNQKSNTPREKINQKQIINNNNPRFSMNNIKPKDMGRKLFHMNSKRPIMGKDRIHMKNNKPVDMGNAMVPMNNSKPVGMNDNMVPMNNSMPVGMGNFMPSNNNMDNSQSSNVTYSTDVDGQLLVSGTTTIKDNSNYRVTSSETNTVLVQNGGTLTLTNSKITKTGDTTNSENSEFLGTNAAILTTYGSTAYIINSTIETDATGANAIFATNTDSSHSGATIYVNDTTIDTYQDKSRGLDATYGGTIIANNVTINTRGGSCAAVATDRGDGTVTVSNSVLNTGVDNGTGQGSPCIYSTGNITAINSTGTSYGAQIACIEGKNSINLINSTLSCSGEGNRQENGNYIDLAGIFIYQSMSGDADVGTAVFTSTNSNLTILPTSEYYTTAPMFYVTNTKGIVTLTNTTVNFGSGTLIKVSNQNQWGTTGSNGGDLTFNAIDESLTGDIVVGDYSSLSLDLKDSTYNGAITTSSSATSSVTIEAGSTWTLTGDSYVTSLTNHGTIICGNYTLYVNGVKYTSD